MHKAHGVSLLFRDPPGKPFVGLEKEHALEIEPPDRNEVMNLRQQAFLSIQQNKSG